MNYFHSEVKQLLKTLSIAYAVVAATAIPVISYRRAKNKSQKGLSLETNP